MKGHGSIIRCTAGADPAVVRRAKACPGIFRTAATGELAREQWAKIGWSEVAIAGGGVGYRCPIHTRLDPHGPIYAYRVDAPEDTQLTMDALGIEDAAPPLLHDGEGGVSGSKGRRS